MKPAPQLGKFWRGQLEVSSSCALPDKLIGLVIRAGPSRRRKLASI
jgi:hypothetical protein